MNGKDVVSTDRYTYKDTDYLLVKTKDGWMYRFQRPDDHNPYTFELRQRPDGSRDNIPNVKLPQSVKDFVHEQADAADVDPKPKRNQPDGSG